MKFSKLQGAGNDFIILNNQEECIPAERLGQLAKHLCRRRFSLGADGLLAVDFPQCGGDYRMRFYNADGNEGEMCGNGARCIARYSYEKGLAGSQQKIETPAGMVLGKRISSRLYQVQLNQPGAIRLNQRIEIDGKEYIYSYMELGLPGVPHVMVELPEFWSMEENQFLTLGRRLRSHNAFPKGANVNFFEMTGKDAVTARTYERGVEDFTLACGTGAGALVTALTLQERVSGADVSVAMPGGELHICVEREDGQITGLYLTGLTNVVATGEIMDEDLLR